MTPDEVIKVEINTSDPNQIGFLQATDSRAGSKEKINDDVVLAAVLSGAFLFVEIPVALSVCATVIGCILAAATLTGTGYAISELGDSIVVNFKEFEKATQLTRFYYCRIQGNSDQTCRDNLDMHSPESGGTNE